MMKKSILLLLAAFCGALAASAQDLIVKTDDARIEAKVIEIAPDAVRYKRFSNPDGPTYVLPVAQIDHIRFANGETERFRPVQSVPATPLVPALPATSDPVAASTALPTPATTAAASASVPVPASTTAPASTPASAAAEAPAAQTLPGGEYILKRYEIGEFYDRDGVKGVVCALSEDRQHGLIISLDEVYLHWSQFRKPDLRLAGTDDRSDGAANMEKLAAYIADNNLSWDDFPAFKWCRDKGQGWYLPSIDELLTIGHNYNGGSRMQNNRQARNKFNDALKEHGGKRMDRLVYYFSSTEMDEKDAFTSHTGIEPPYVVEIPKYNKFLVRAVRKF